MRTLKNLMYVFTFVFFLFSANAMYAATEINAEMQQAARVIKGNV